MKPLSYTMRVALKRIFDTGGHTWIVKPHSIGENTLIALENRELIETELDPARWRWNVRLTDKGLEEAQRRA